MGTTGGSASGRDFHGANAGAASGAMDERFEGLIEQRADSEDASGLGDDEILLGNLKAARDAEYEMRKRKRGAEEDFARRGITVLGGFGYQRKNSREDVVGPGGNAFEQRAPVGTLESRGNGIGKDGDGSEGIAGAGDGGDAAASDVEGAAIVADPGAVAACTDEASVGPAAERGGTGPGDDDNAGAFAETGVEGDIEVGTDLDVGMGKRFHEEAQHAFEDARLGGAGNSGAHAGDGRSSDLMSREGFFRCGAQRGLSAFKPGAQGIGRAGTVLGDDLARGVEEHAVGLGAAAVESQEIFFAISHQGIRSQLLRHRVRAATVDTPIACP